jgi:hypothetical protein
MRRSVFAWVLAWLAFGAGHAAELTPTERRWLDGLWPVVAFARAASLPMDIVVQPQPAPGAAPLALAFIGGRCKLVLSMRGNREAQATLDRIEPELLAPALELMAAHELGHCHRHLAGEWQTAAAVSFAGADDAAGKSGFDLQVAARAMAARRQEEGYADLVGLSWTRLRHPQHYARLHAWLVAERSKDRIPGSHHDTLAWLGVAQQGDALVAPTLFDGAAAVWTAALVAGDAPGP